MVSLTRVISPEQTLTPEQWLAHFSGKFSGEDLALMQGALELAQTYYPKDAKTQMGEPMLSHVLSATYFVDEMHIFADALAATVLSASPRLLSQGMNVDQSPLPFFSKSLMMS